MQSGHPPVIGLAYGSYAAPYDRMPLLSFSKWRRITIRLEYKNRADGRGPLFLIWHNQEFYAVPKKELSHLFAWIPEWWRDYKPCRTVEDPTSLMFLYLKSRFFDGREPN